MTIEQAWQQRLDAVALIQPKQTQINALYGELKECDAETAKVKRRELSELQISARLEREAADGDWKDFLYAEYGPELQAEWVWREGDFDCHLSDGRIFQHS